MTSHAAIVSRELEVPAVVGTESGTIDIDDGETIRVDGEKGHVKTVPAEQLDDQRSEQEEAGADQQTEKEAAGGDRRSDPGQSQPKPMTATEVKVNISIPSAAQRAADTGADGVGLLRTEHMIVSTNKTPQRYVKYPAPGGAGRPCLVLHC